VAEERFEFPKEALPFLVVSLIVQERKTMSLIIGLDPHKASNTIAVLEPDETIRLTHRFENSDAGFVAMLKHVEGFRDRKWAVEGASGMGRSVAQRLVRAGETVVDVPPNSLHKSGYTQLGTVARPTRRMRFRSRKQRYVRNVLDPFRSMTILSR
jgi:hypothetical protein